MREMLHPSRMADLRCVALVEPSGGDSSYNQTT